jgi:ER-bound oxygenase mpaB/B'/Rubber oxygenase, catalytic domain
MTASRESTPRRALTELRGRDLGRVINADEAIARYGTDTVQPLFDGMLTADDLALDVVDDFRAMHGGPALYRRAIEEGIDAVPEAPESMRRMFEQMESVPDWVDWDQLRRGSIAYFRAGPLVPFVFTCASIAGGDQSYGTTRPLVFSGRFEEKAYVRSSETVRWLLAATRPGGMCRDNEGWKLTAHVRLMHAYVRRAEALSPKWDWDDWGMPISDTDGLYSISYAFSGVYIEALVRSGFRFTHQDLEDLYALWRYIGHVIGVPHHMLHRDAAQARQFADMFLLLNPGPDEPVRRLVHSLIELATPVDGGDNFDVFPPIVTKVMPPLRLRKLMYGLMRFWLGDEVADQFRAPNPHWKYAGYGLRAGVGLYELGRRLRLVDDEKACRSAIALLDKATRAREGQTVLAPTDEVVTSIENTSSPALVNRD